MSDQFVGEIRWFPYRRGVPTGWRLCDGGLLAISEFQTLFTLIGTTYGGNGVTQFAVPDLRGRLPIHQGTGMGLTPRPIGQTFGTEDVTLTASQLGGHSHVLMASTDNASASGAANMVLAAIGGNDALYLIPTSATASPLAPCVQATGGSQPHENCAPTLTIQACIATDGLFPSQS